MGADHSLCRPQYIHPQLREGDIHATGRIWFYVATEK